MVKDEFDGQGDFVQVELLQQMHALRCEEGVDPCPTLETLTWLKSEYATAGETIDDNVYKAIIISCLPTSY